MIISPRPLSRVVFSKGKNDWETPQHLVPFDCDLDVCATRWNTKCRRYFTPAQNGLLQPWHAKHAWCNPPYSDKRSPVERWLAKAHQELALGNCQRVTFLVPSRTSNRWWHKHVEPYRLKNRCSVRFVKGRITFVGAKANAPFPSVFITFWRDP